MRNKTLGLRFNQFVGAPVRKSSTMAVAEMTDDKTRAA
jgi:hypothetical protein